VRPRRCRGAGRPAKGMDMWLYLGFLGEMGEGNRSGDKVVYIGKFNNDVQEMLVSAVLSGTKPCGTHVHR
jgi:hypothetical protein